MWKLTYRKVYEKDDASNNQKAMNVSNCDYIWDFYQCSNVRCLDFFIFAIRMTHTVGHDPVRAVNDVFAGRLVIKWI